MPDRELADVQRDLANWDQSHAQNETNRDAFLAVAHTALFAASIAFVGDVVKIDAAQYPSVLIASWVSSVVGMLALTLSFQVARRTLDRFRRTVYEGKEQTAHLLGFVNFLALWSFPITLICLAAFVTINVWNVVPNTPPPSPPKPVRVERGATPAPRAPARPSTGSTPAPRPPAAPTPAPTPKK